MRSSSALALAASLLAAASAAARTGLVQPAATSAGGQAAVLADIEKAFDQREKNVELQYAKLIQDARQSIDALNDKIKALDFQIELLKESAKKHGLSARNIEKLNVKISSAQKEIKVLRNQIADLQKEIVRLQRDRDKALADLRAQKQKAIEQAHKISLSRAVSPREPTPKKP